MILRKPYAFFIKMFKPIHLVLGVLIAYLLYFENKMFGFLDKNMYSSLNFVGQNIKEKYVSSVIYLIPIVVILLFIGILTIMYYKKKPILFYVVGIFAMIAVLVVNVYANNFFKVLEESIVSIKTVKLIHDLIFISMLVEGVLLLFMVIRGAGVNIKKFNFDSDISKIDIKESDNEEFEVNIAFNMDKTKREHNRRIRYLKYAYAEKKLLINIVALSIIVVIGLVVFLLVNNREKVYQEKELISTATSSILVDNAYFLNKSYEGKTITDNMLVVVDLKMKLNYKSAVVYLKDFNINIGNAMYTPTTMYNKYLIDLGSGYYDGIATLDYSNYLFVYEIPSDQVSKKIIFTYNDGENIQHIRIKPILIDSEDEEIIKNTGDVIELSDKLAGIKFKINSYDIQDRYILKYNFCIDDNNCINSIEYLKATLNENYDKSLIKINVEYENNSELKLSSFYNLLNTYGYIEYKIGDKVKTQKKIEEAVSTKLSQKNIVYLGVNSEIKNANEVNLVFNVRGKKYIYNLKEGEV